MVKKILIVDDHLVVRSKMTLLLEKKIDGVFVVGVNNFEEALSACATIIFDLVILDIDLPDERKCNIIDDLRKMQKEVKILIFSAHEKDIFVFRYIQAGADGYLNKFSKSSTIIKTVNTILELGKYTSSNILDEFIAFSKNARESRSILEDFTQREMEIAKLLVEGCGNLEVRDKNEYGKQP
ncbi:response regulator [Flavobacterium sp. WC2509]|uniref:response regulator n=1 Tax=Flavobacterium sp. WC2509 TaxID=3461406 RepID=UPI004043E776